MYHVKRGVIMCGVKKRMQPAIDVCVEVYNDFGYELTITSGIDGIGIHREGSKHFKGEAIDTRTRIFANDNEKRVIFRAIKEKLGCGFLIVLESTHFHIQTVTVQ